MENCLRREMKGLFSNPCLAYLNHDTEEGGRVGGRRARGNTSAPLGASVGRRRSASLSPAGGGNARLEI
uniref:Uncharacterized protein n=1 Tax=Setaria italica TaxID=4555 RepID=K3ZYS8_SETIT